MLLPYTRADLVLTPSGLRYCGRVMPCSIGSGGLTNTKREGDHATPRGILRITDILYRPDRMRAPSRQARPIGPRDLWSDDPERYDYNSLVRVPYAGSHEVLRRADPLYDLVLVTDWNIPATPGRGSAIFLHRWRRPCAPTEGCLAVSSADLAWIARRITRGARVII